MNYLIPNFVVRRSREEPSLILEMLSEEEIGKNDVEKVLLVFIYLFRNETRFGDVRFTLKDLIESSGYALKTGKGKTNDRFKKILAYLQKKELIVSDSEMAEIKANDFVVVKLNYFELNEEGKKVNYFMLSDDEINSIYEIEDVDNRKLLLYFSSLKSRIKKSSKNGKEESETTYSSMLKITEEVGLTERIGYTYNKLLRDIGLIYY